MEPLPGADAVWHAVVDAIEAHVAVLDRDGLIVAVNDAWRKFGSSEGDGSDHVGESYLAVCDRAQDATAAEVAALLREMQHGARDGFELTYPCHSPSERRWFSLRARWAPDGAPLIVLSHTPVTDHHLDATAARRHASVLCDVDVPIVTADRRGTVLSWNTAAATLLGWTASEAIGSALTELLAGSLDPNAIGEIGEHGCELELRLARPDGTLLFAHVSARLVRDDEDPGEIILLTFQDSSGRLESARQLERTRNHLLAVTHSMGEGMYTLDLDGRVTFMNRAAEDLLGWSFDELRGSVMHDIIQPEAAARGPYAGIPAGVAANLPAALPTPGAHPIARATRRGESVRVDGERFLCADGTWLPVAYTAAPLQSGTDAEGCVVVFEDITERSAEAERLIVKAEKLEWVRRIREALDRDLFELYAQPMARLSDGVLVQSELLLRMHDAADARRVISPSQFLPVAEELGFVREIDRWVLGRAAAVAAAGETVHVNVSALSIGESWLLPQITRDITRLAVDPSRMVFEITETALVRDEAQCRRFAERVHALGCRIALDDFGSGYSGFRYLKQIPLDYLKIDIEFVRDIADNPASRSVVEAVVTLAQKFGLQTIAEGVEDARAYTLLRELGVDYAQGHHVGRPASMKPIARAA